MWRKGMEALARQPNVFVKVSEFGLADRPWEFDSNRRVVHGAIAIFGVERAMVGSDMPACRLRIGFSALIRATKRMVAHLSAGDQESFFWRNARAFYRL